MKDMMKGILIILFIGLLIFGGIRWDIYRWHTFQEVTDSDIGYWKWKFVIDDNKSGISGGKK
jgi:hypothetical protein